MKLTPFSELKYLSTMPMHACLIRERLGEPEIEETDTEMHTSWHFSYPADRHTWMILHSSVDPVLHDTSCVNDELVFWDLFGESKDIRLWNELATFLAGEKTELWSVD